MNQQQALPHLQRNRIPKSMLVRDIVRDRWLYFLLAPGVLYFIIFKYVPMWGLIMAFQDYQPHLGFLGSPWVGLKHFERFFAEPQFWMLFRNTLLLAIYNLVFFSRCLLFWR